MPKVEDRRREKNQSSNITQTKIILNDVSSNKVSKQKVLLMIYVHVPMFNSRYIIKQESINIFNYYTKSIIVLHY